jgi:hypothetical protein
MIEWATLCIPVSRFVPHWNLGAVSFFLGSCEMPCFARRHVPHPYQRNLTIDKVSLKG